jgi:hypothetical protein
MVRRSVLPYSAPHRTFTAAAEVPLGPYGFAQGTITAGGTLTLAVGPQAAGTAWELAQAAISTATGAADTSTCAIYAQPYGPASAQWLVGQSYAGGGDQVGLAGVRVVRGEYVVAVWSGAHPGDVATLILSGTMRALVNL